MKLLILLALVTIIYGAPADEIPSQAADSNIYCYSNDTVKEQKVHYATKTAYQFVKGRDYENFVIVPNCKPIKMWLFNRHGTRLPELSVIKSLGDLEKRRDEIVKNYEDGRINYDEGGLCREDVNMIRNWKRDMNITEQYQQYLVAQGWDDLKLLAKDYQSVYPDLLPNKYDPKHFLFRHTALQRTEASYKAFVEGLFGVDAYKSINLDPIPEKDLLLDPHDNCDLFEKQGDDVKAAGTEIDKFQHSPILNKVIQEVSARLGYEKPLEYADVDLMFEMCRFEQAWSIEDPSTWCTAFTLENIKVLEYFEDIKHEYKAGYVGDLNPKVPCEVVQDMLKKLSNDDEPAVTAYFSHSTLLYLILVAFGAFKDKNLLLTDNYDSMQNRQWDGSQIMPFAANLAVIKYNCTTDKAENSTKLRFFYNQKPFDVDWCKDGLCELKDVMAKLSYYYTADCPNEYCRVESSANLLKGSIYVAAIVILSNILNLF